MNKLRNYAEQLTKLLHGGDVVFIGQLNRNVSDRDAERPASDENLDVARRQTEQQAHER